MTEAKMPDIDPKALYTVEQAARMLMEIRPELTFEEAHKQVCDAIDGGTLPVAGYLKRPERT